jgi:hypothetical protein
MEAMPRALIGVYAEIPLVAVLGPASWAALRALASHLAGAPGLHLDAKVTVCAQRANLPSP